MRKITQNLLLLTAASLFIFSCGEDEEPTASVPSVSVSASVDGTAISSGDEVQVGSVVDFTVSITAPGGVNGLTVNGTSLSRTQLGAEAGDTDATYNFSSNAVEAADLGSILTTTVVAVDDLGQESAEVVFEINPASPVAKVQTAIILAAPDAEGDRDAFYSVAGNLLYSHNDVVGTSEAVSQNIDFAYYFGNSDEASLVSPSEYPASVFDISAWGTRNETAMVQLVDFTSEDFMGLVTVADVEAALESVSDETAVLGFTGLEVGSVIAFETAGEIAGVLIVQDITTGFSGNIELEMVLAEAAE